jgi:uncharacterized protein
MALPRNPPRKFRDRLFLDTGFCIARFNQRDQYHAVAKALAQRLGAFRELWTTDAVLLEIGAAFSQPDRRTIVLQLWDQFHGGDPRCRLAAATGPSLDQAVDLFRSRADKAWSLADCLSFTVMESKDLTDALTADQHFVQAGFRALLLEDREEES